MSVPCYYGAKPDPPDDRDFRKVYDHAGIAFDNHPMVDLREYVGQAHIYAQNKLKSCTANAVCAAYGLDLTKQSKTNGKGYSYFNPSRLFLYYNTRENEATEHNDPSVIKKDDGATLRDTCKIMKRHGVCHESLWKYDETKFAQKPPKSCYDDAQGNSIKYECLEQDIYQLRACLIDNCPFVFSFKVFESFHHTDCKEHGNLPMPTQDELDSYTYGRHAVMAVGYDDKKKHFIIQNSEGPDWGNKGYFYMPYDFIKNDKLCRDFWRISFACEKGITPPKPTPRIAVAAVNILEGLFEFAVAGAVKAGVW